MFFLLQRLCVLKVLWLTRAFAPLCNSFFSSIWSQNTARPNKWTSTWFTPLGWNPFYQRYEVTPQFSEEKLGWKWTLQTGNWISYGLDTFQLYQVGMLFPANIIKIFVSSFGDSVVSLCSAVWEVWIWILLPPGLPLSDSCAKIKPWVLQGRNLSCSPRMPGLLGEAAWARGFPGGGLCWMPPWQNSEYLKGLQEGLSASKKDRVLFPSQLFFFLYFSKYMFTSCQLQTGAQRALPAYPLLSWWYFILQEMLLLSILLGRRYSASPQLLQLKD